MKKRSYILMTYALAILLGVALFLTSERVQRAERIYDDIQEKLTTEREAYHILQTEWTYLNRPDRLEDLAATHLKLTPLKPDATLTSVVNLPEFVQPVETEKSVVTAEIANAVAPASGTNNDANDDTNIAPSSPVIASTNNMTSDTSTSTLTAEATPTPASAIIPVSAPASSVQKATVARPQQTVSKKSQRAHRNTSTAGVTFYQYMNRASSPKASGGAR